MPAILGIYTLHPETQEAGLWIALMDGTVRGLTTAELNSLTPAQRENLLRTRTTPWITITVDANGNVRITEGTSRSFRSGG